jgi:hypothetical protein
MGWETEIPDVVAGQPVESVWGNEIRDKVVHVVATAAALPTDVADGGLAYQEDIDVLKVRLAGVWVPVGALGGIVVGSNVNQSNINLTTGFQSLASFALALPTYWHTFTCQLEGFTNVTGITASNDLELRFNVGGVIHGLIVDNGSTIRTVLNYADMAAVAAAASVNVVLQGRNATAANGVAVTSGIRCTAIRDT